MSSSSTAAAAAVTQGPAFRVPILPHTAPEAGQPPGLKLPLLPHQLRALNRCLVTEQDGSLLNRDFGHRFDYKSRGGCLADSVGTGKTATSIGLVLSGREESDNTTSSTAADEERGGTLVVAPAHLIPQWKHEIYKFAGDAIQVLVGKQEYERACRQPLPSHCTRRIVLVSVDAVLNEDKVWYDWRRVFTKPPDKGGRQIKRGITARQLDLYRKAGNYCVKSPKGPCSYEGWVYTGSLHLPRKPWRRVIFDEIQDLVSEGTVSQKNLLQLSRTAQHVWLLSATPFPHGNSSVYANHELLGFCRLRVDVETPHQLPKHHVFERIKRQLYIRSPRHVADQAVTASQTVTRTTQSVPQLDLERRFYDLECNSIQENNSGRAIVADNSLFGSIYYPLREMAVHPEASEKLREQMTQSRARSNNNSGSFVRPVSGSVNQAGQRAILAAKARLHTLQSQDLKRATKQLRDTTRSLKLAEKIQAHRARPVATSVFAANNSGTDVTQKSREEEAKLVHDHYCLCSDGLGSRGCCADRQVCFRIIREENSTEAEFIQGCNATKRVIHYLDGFRRTTTEDRFRSLQHYISASKRSESMRKEHLQNLEKEKRELKLRIETLSAASKSGTVQGEGDLLAATHGSKPAALVRFLQSVTANGAQVIVFSYWHDTLKLIGQTLLRCGLRSVFCCGDGNAMSMALNQFTTGATPILLLSAQSKASGANLQCASHVVLLDPAGSSAEHGSTLEEQAVGRAVRMGQSKPVKVTRFCVTGTIEEELFAQIDVAAESAKLRASDAKYVIHDCNNKAAVAPRMERKKAQTSAEEDDVNDIKITQAVSASERIRRDFQKAQETGNVISLDSDDDGDDGDKNEEAKAPLNNTLSTLEAANKPAASATIKPEPVTVKRVSEGANGNSSSEPQSLEPVSKRMRSEQEESQTPFPTAAAETTTRGVTPGPPGSSTASVSSLSSTSSEQGADQNRSNAKPVERFDAVRELLDRLDLSEYAPEFLESGFDSLDWLLRFAQDSSVMEQLASAVGFKPGHAVRFQFGLTKEVAKAAQQVSATSSSSAAAAADSLSDPTVWI